MGWETRGARRYYYRKTRGPDGCVRSEYVGSDPVALLWAQHDEAERAERERQRRAMRREFRPLDEHLDALLEAERALRTLTRAVLLASGFHAHRGQWRKRRILPDTSETMPKSASSIPTAQNTHADENTLALPTDEAVDLMQRCNRTDATPADVQALRKYLDATPGLHYPSAVSSARVNLYALGSGGNALRTELQKRAMREHEAALGHAEADPLTRTLIEHVTACYFTLEHITALYARKLGEQHTLELADHYEKRLTKAQTRYLRAVENLERVRKLRRRAPLHVTVAEAGSTVQQINA